MSRRDNGRLRRDRCQRFVLSLLRLFLVCGCHRCRDEKWRGRSPVLTKDCTGISTESPSIYVLFCCTGYRTKILARHHRCYLRKPDVLYRCWSFARNAVYWQNHHLPPHDAGIRVCWPDLFQLNPSRLIWPGFLKTVISPDQSKTVNLTLPPAML